MALGMVGAGGMDDAGAEGAGVDWEGLVEDGDELAGGDADAEGDWEGDGVVRGVHMAVGAQYRESQM